MPVSDATVLVDGQPMFNATMLGLMSTFVSPYFYMDMTNSKTIVWDKTC
jgi:hypothetical protein